MRISRKTKKVFKSLLCAVLCIGVVFGAVSLIGGLKADKEYDRVRLSYDVGGLNETGKYVETKLSLYTKNGFECENKAIRISPKFDSSISYEVHFYDDEENNVGEAVIGTETQIIEAPEGATHARIEITPIWGDDVKEADKDLSFLDTYKYARQLVVEVSVDDLVPEGSPAA